MEKINWYPGHMTKTRRMIADQLGRIDVVCEILDARIPISSRNPDIDQLVAGKPRLILMNRADQADPEATAKWSAWFRSHGHAVVETDGKSGAGVNRFVPAVRKLAEDKLARYAQQGQVGRTLKVMVLGIPNVGKSTIINRLAKRKIAKAEDRPGVTRTKQLVVIAEGIELLDTPGILWPKFEDPKTGLHLAFTGAVRDEILDLEGLAAHLMETLARHHAGALEQRYRIKPEEGCGGYDLLEQAGRKRGFLISGGEVDLERMAKILLDEFRGGKLGHCTLEWPEDLEGAEDHGTGPVEH